MIVSKKRADAAAQKQHEERYDTCTRANLKRKALNPPGQTVSERALAAKSPYKLKPADVPGGWGVSMDFKGPFTVKGFRGEIGYFCAVLVPQ